MDLNRNKSFFTVSVINPQLNTRHVLELSKYEWNPEREDYDRISYQPIQIAEPAHNPVPNVSGLQRNDSHPIRLEKLRPEVMALLQPHRRPLAPVFGSSANPIVVMDSAETNYVRVFESPASPDPVPPASPINIPTKRNTPSPPLSPSKVQCEGPIYIPLQDHQFELPTCPLPSSPTLNGFQDLGMHGKVWPSERLPPSLQPAARPRRPRRQVGEVRGALLSDQEGMLPHRQARVLPLGHHLILLQDILYHRRDKLLIPSLGELLAGICLRSLPLLSPDLFRYIIRHLTPAPRP